MRCAGRMLTFVAIRDGSPITRILNEDSLLQLDTWFGRPKKSGRGGGMRNNSGSNTMPRPHSGDDINEIEQQRSIIERMDEETVNDKFEEMLVSGDRVNRLVAILANLIANCFVSAGQHESNGGEEGAAAPAIGLEEEGDAGPALQGYHTGQPVEIRQAGRLHTVSGAARSQRQQDLQLHRVAQDRAHQQSAQLGARVRHEGTQAGLVHAQRMLPKVSGSLCEPRECR